MILPHDGTEVTTISTLIQLSVAPVFLIAGVAGLLNVLTSRFTRTIDKLELMDSIINTHEKEDDACNEETQYLLQRRKFLIMRMQNVNASIFFTTATGLMIALVIISVFFSSLFSFNSEVFISVSFILAMVFLIIALMLFLSEIYFTNQFIRTKKKSTHI
ncbi:MAG: DUF2721 domain-containing protein [Arcobacteraceae bacterium]|nr:DUF2721 domain-containing protein [Arcobacteraceae bacterium]